MSYLAETPTNVSFIYWVDVNKNNNRKELSNTQFS